jgi:hypothetical protein
MFYSEKICVWSKTLSCTWGVGHFVHVGVKALFGLIKLWIDFQGSEKYASIFFINFFCIFADYDLIFLILNFKIGWNFGKSKSQSRKIAEKLYLDIRLQPGYINYVEKNKYKGRHLRKSCLNRPDILKFWWSNWTFVPYFD